MIAAWKALFSGIRQPPLDSGNRSNAPASPPVQAGSYEYIQQPMFGNQDIVMVPSIPPAFRNMATFGVNVVGPGGTTGGGINNGAAFDIPSPEVLYYDESTGMYVNLG